MDANNAQSAVEFLSHCWELAPVGSRLLRIVLSPDVAVPSVPPER